MNFSSLCFYLSVNLSFIVLASKRQQTVYTMSHTVYKSTIYAYFQKYADDYFSTYNNTTYNSIEPDICHLVYVAKVETLKESEVGLSL